MDEITRILTNIDRGDTSAAKDLLPLVYEELRKLAAIRMANEQPGQTLQATALVHEAYVRLVGTPFAQPWNSRGHFFAAAAEAMRRILVEQARRKNRLKHGGDHSRVDLDAAADLSADGFEEVLDLDEALRRFERIDDEAAQVVKLRYFAGLTMPQAAQALGIPLRNAERHWTYARSWLHRELSHDDTGADGANL